MIHLRLNEGNFEEVLEKTQEIVGNGGVIIYPTDTVYGLGADITNEKAIEKIYRLKKRVRNKPMSFICSDFQQIGKFAVLSNPAFRFMRHVLPGAFTFIAQASPDVPKSVVERKRRTIGIRMPDYRFCLELVKRLKSPIITTSVNYSGEDPWNDPFDIISHMGDKVDLFIDAGLLGNEPSTIIDVTVEPFAIIRQGKGKI
jgi:tRNA threonylcarbamoyl adenosine modification protein (Sua5/YciO/YrdC/YwlC family)